MTLTKNLDPDHWQEISKAEFFSTVGRRDVHPTPVDPWPYVCHWKTRGGYVVAYSIPENRYPYSDHYFVPKH